MRKTDSLFQLIKSLSRADKRNFKLLTQITAGDKKYLRLFDLIDQGAVFDESKLLPIFEGKNATSQLSVAKHYLYSAILKSLVYFRRDDHEDTATTSTQLKILLERNLHPQAAKLLRKAKSDAWAKEQFTALLDLLMIERRLLLDLGHHKELAQLHVEEATARACLACLGQCQAILDACQVLCGKHPQARSVAAIAAMDGHMAALAELNFSGQHCQRALLLRYRVQRLDAAFRMDVPALVRTSEALAELAGGKRHLLSVLEVELPQILHELAEAYLAAKDLPAARRVLATYQGLEAGTQRGLSHWWSRKQLLEMQLMVQETDFERLDPQLAALSDGLAIYKDSLGAGQLYELYFHAGRLCFAAGRFREALRWINHILNGHKLDAHSDLQIYARLLSMMVHLELGNTDLIEHNLVSTYRFMFGRNWMFPVERDVMRYLKTLVGHDDPAQRPQYWRSIHDELMSSACSSLDQVAREALLVRPWVAWHVHGGSIAERISAERDAILADDASSASDCGER
jgi:tetratricopeptide (TPR) repeat protein